MAAEVNDAPAIELAGVVKDFGGERVLDGVDLEVPRGKVTVLIGPSGAGKTVTVKHVLGLFKPTKGVVKVDGRDLAKLDESELNEVRRGMGVVLQGTLPFTCGLFFSMNVYENVAFAIRERQPRWPAERVEEVTLEHLGLVGMRDWAEAMPEQLSAGMCKRTAIARALALDARIVVVDDFDSGIDGVRLALLCELLADAQRQTNATYLVTTHDMSAARTLADHAAVIHAGRIVASGEAEEVLESAEPMVRQFVAGELSGPLGLGG